MGSDHRLKTAPLLPPSLLYRMCIPSVSAAVAWWLRWCRCTERKTKKTKKKLTENAFNMKENQSKFCFCFTTILLLNSRVYLYQNGQCFHPRKFQCHLWEIEKLFFFRSHRRSVCYIVKFIQFCFYSAKSHPHMLQSTIVFLPWLSTSWIGDSSRPLIETVNCNHHESLWSKVFKAEPQCAC